jgi:hypothetical protein
LTQVLALIRNNLLLPFTLRDEGTPADVLPGNRFAATVASDPDPKVSVCDPFFASRRDLQRDVVTHEYSTCWDSETTP